MELTLIAPKYSPFTTALKLTVWLGIVLIPTEQQQGKTHARAR